MIEVNGNYLAADELEILNELKHQLELNGIHRFAKVIKTTNNLQTNCPFHKEGQERKPSFGIMLNDSGRYKEGTCHCFTCGWTGSFAEMVSNLFGYDDFGNYGNKWLAKNFLTIEVNNRPTINLDSMDRSKQKQQKRETVSEEELDSYRQYHPYMWKRKMTPETVEIFDIGYDEKTRCITFPIRDVNGNCLFIARRSVVTKFFNYPADVEKPVYGLYELHSRYPVWATDTMGMKRRSFPNTVYICESMINAITIWGWGDYAVALNGTGTQEQYKQLCKMPNRTFILALDPDKAGEHGREKLRKALKGKILYDLVLPKGKDVNDLTKEEFENLPRLFN